MNILFLTRLYKPHVGGVEKHVAEIVSRLSKNHSVRIVTELYDKELSEEEMENDVIIHRILLPKNKTSKLAIWIWMLQNRKLFFQADVIHVHDVFFWVFPLLPRIRNKLFMTFHGYEGSDIPNWRQKFWHRVAHVVSKKSIAIGGFHEKWYGVKSDIISYGAVDIHEVKNKKRKKNAIIFIGRLERDNGILVYLDALKILKDRGVVYTLDVFGNGSLMSECQNFVKKHEVDVEFHGFVSGAQRFLPHYQTAFVSRYLAIFEALAAKTSVIAHYNNEIKRDYLELSPFSNWISITHSAQKIADAVMNPKKVSPEACEWVSRQTWTKMSENYEKLWRN